MPAVQRESWWRVLRGLALALLLAVLLLHVAMPRVRVSPGDQLRPNNSVKPPRLSGKPDRDGSLGTKAQRDDLPDGGGEEGEANPSGTAPGTLRPGTE